jgi:probable F420-dependent oxidoreductase
VDVGVFLPVSGRAAGPDVLTEAAAQAERLGFASVWSAERVVQPWEITTTYPYSEDHVFIVPPDRPFLDAMTCLTYLAGRTERVRLGISVMVLPYRHPLYWARVAASLDRLSRGRFILGVGVGWMAEEFAALGTPFAARGRMTDEQLDILHRLRTQERVSFTGEHYRFDDVAFHPKPDLHAMPVWVGGEARAARRRAARYGDAWFPYFVRITAAELGALHGEVRSMAAAEGRDPDAVALALCRSIELTADPVPREPDRLRGSPEQLAEALLEYVGIGVSHLALQFMVPRWPERREQIERFASEVMPALGL